MQVISALKVDDFKLSARLKSSQQTEKGRVSAERASALSFEREREEEEGAGTEKTESVRRYTCNICLQRRVEAQTPVKGTSTQH